MYMYKAVEEPEGLYLRLKKIWCSVDADKSI